MCDCISYNRPDLCPADGTPSIMLLPPYWSSKKGICVDACIADAIKMLWDNDIVTCGSCCGHNRLNPSVVLDSAADGQKALNLLLEKDGRDWEVFQWRLMSIDKDDRVWKEDSGRPLE